MFRNRETLERIAAETRGIAVICGLVTPAQAETGKSVMNSAALFKDGGIVFLQSKMLLPTYDVFDEMRNFAPAKARCCFRFAASRWRSPSAKMPGTTSISGTSGCTPSIPSKLWFRLAAIRAEYFRVSVLAGQARTSPRRCWPPSRARTKFRWSWSTRLAATTAWCSTVRAWCLNSAGEVIAQGKSFEEDLIYFDSERLTGEIHPQIEGEEASAYAALVLGTRDYVRKCGFSQVMVGLSGGIDSALTAGIAAEAARTRKCHRSGMPGPYSSTGSIDDARALATNLGMASSCSDHRNFRKLHKTLSKLFAGRKEDVTEENIQSRTRGTLLIALCKKFGAIVLSTGNKSELGVGYCTLYGDMVGGLAVISDVPKTLVYRLSHYVNSRRAVIPQASLEKPPSAELRPGQIDSDSLPPTTFSMPCWKITSRTRTPPSRSPPIAAMMLAW